MKQNQKMLMNNVLSTNISLILVTIQKIQSFFIRLIKKFFDKIKDESEGKAIGDFVGLK